MSQQNADKPWMDLTDEKAAKLRDWMTTQNYIRAANMETKACAPKWRHAWNTVKLWAAFHAHAIKRFGFWHSVKFFPLVNYDYARSVYKDGFMTDDFTSIDEFDAMDEAATDMGYWEE